MNFGWSSAKAATTRESALRIAVALTRVSLARAELPISGSRPILDPVYCHSNPEAGFDHGGYGTAAYGFRRSQAGTCT